ncbi:hypothetical protein [Thalassovita sp.]|uniref:hypothetical protein n=1 Tax=Thalassovita sp. TaxID=1979401 RepID=UPI0029DE7A8A|nr:hypothetical protein [Thalassovita sp.]
MRWLLTLFLFATSVLFSTLPALHAQQLTTHDLRGASFAVPADWTITYSSRDQETDFASPDRRYQLWMRWWMQDEPLLGYDDIQRHQKMQLAGQEALFIHTETGAERMLQMAFLQKDDEGEIFLVQLIGTNVSLAEHEEMFRKLLLGLSLHGVPVKKAAQGAPGKGAADTTQAGVFRDPGGAFSIPAPQGWDVQTTASVGLSQVVVVAPARNAMVLAVVARPDRGMTAAAVLDEYLGVLYRDSLVVKSIEDEGYPTIAGTEAHMVESTARVYAINGVAMPYPRGLVRIYRTEGASAQSPFLILSIRPDNADLDLTRQLSEIALGFRPDVAAQPAPAGQPEPSPPAVADNGQDNPSPPPARGLLFDGRSLTGLLPLAFNGADFDTHALFTESGLAFAFPEGLGWAKLGVSTDSTVIEMPNRDATAVQRITAIVDADNSTGITFALTPADKAQLDPWEAHDLRFQLFNWGEGLGTMKVTMRDDSRTLDARFAWPKGETVLHLLLRPDHVIELRDGSGVQLAELALPVRYEGRGWVLQTYVQVNRKNRAAGLVLKRLSVDTIPHVPTPRLDAFAQDGAPVVLFDGYALGRFWTPASRYESGFAQFARMSGGALRIGWTAADKGYYTGIATPESVLWLDRFTGAAEARVDLALDGAASTDWEISLYPRYALPDNRSGSGAYVLRFARQDDGTFHALSALRSDEDEGLSASGLASIPDHVSLILTPEGVRVSGPGMPVGVLPFPNAVDGVGLRMAIHALPTAQKDGALVLRGVRLSRRPGTVSESPSPADGVAPLPQVVFFETRPQDTWTGLSSGAADFTAQSEQTPDGLRLWRRDPAPDWNRPALVGSAIVADLDYRVDSTPYELTLQITPEPGLGTRIYLHDDAARYEKRAIATLTLRELPDGPEVGGLEVQLHSGHFSYDHWRRVIPAGQWQRDWDGTVRLRLGPDWIAAALGDDWLMRGARTPRKMMLAIAPGGAGNNDTGRVTLRRIEGGWITPSGMTGSERQRLVDTAEFDPDTYLDLLASEHGEPAQ